MIKILFIGDIVGKAGRKAVKAVLPKLKKQYKPDLIIANAENLAHGKGVTPKTLQEMLDAGIDFFTSGNHVFDNAEAAKVFSDHKFPIIRPANYPPQAEGAGYKIIKAGTKKVLIANLMGRVFMKENFDCPFRSLSGILKKCRKEKLDAVIVDLHAEATSEKISLGHYFDGQISLLIGTHTHVQTADEQILPKGTGFITDAGMTGVKYSSLGVGFDKVIEMFLTQKPTGFEIPESGACIVNAVFAIIKEEKTTEIKRVKMEIKI